MAAAKERLNGALNARQESSIAVNAAWHSQTSVWNMGSVQQRQPLIEQVAFILKPLRDYMLAAAAARWPSTCKAFFRSNTAL
jgi:hypothetical protein